MQQIVTEVTYYHEAFEGWPLVPDPLDVEMINHFVVEVYTWTSLEGAVDYIESCVRLLAPELDRTVVFDHLMQHEMLEVHGPEFGRRWTITPITDISITLD